MGRVVGRVEWIMCRLWIKSALSGPDSHRGADPLGTQSKSGIPAIILLPIANIDQPSGEVYQCPDETGIEVACAVCLDGFAPGIVSHRQSRQAIIISQLARNIDSIVEDVIPSVCLFCNWSQSVQNCCCLIT